MDKLKHHWTQTSISAFVHRLSFDFVTQLHKKLDAEKIAKKDFAARLKVTPGRVSQILNDPGNITLESAVEYAMAIGMKVALVAYDDHDPENEKGPVNSEIFERCWDLQRRPHNFFEVGSPSGRMLQFRFSFTITSDNSAFGGLPSQLGSAKPEQEATTLVKYA